MEKLIDFSFKICTELCHKEFSKFDSVTFRQSIKFSIVGVSNTFIGYILYVAALRLIQSSKLLPNLDYFVAQTVSFVISVYWSFYWNNKLVFTLIEGEYRSYWRSLMKTYISYSFTGLFLSTILLYVWVDILGVSEYIAPIINLIVTVPLNFIINKFWAFKAK